MRTQKVAIALLASVILAGCGEWKQNPLDGKKGNFDAGQGVPTKPDFSKPLPSDVVKINLPDFQAFQEGVRAEFPITARILREGYTAEIAIENMKDFPGAMFNKTTGIFSWQPPVGFLESIGEKAERTTRSLSVKAYGYKPNDQVLIGEEERPIYISREFKVPEILSITKPEGYIREGATMLIPVVVLDRDAVEADRTTWPKVLPQSVAGNKNLAGISTVYRDEAVGGGQYRTYIQVDLRDMEVTDAVDTFSMTLTAASRFGKLSIPRTLSLDVYTQLMAPTTTWTTPLQITATTPTTYTFLVTDPKLEAFLALDHTMTLPMGSTMNCQQAGRGLMNCTFTWTPSEFQTGQFDFSIYVRSRNFDSRDTAQQIKTLYFRAQVLPKGI